MLRSLVTVGASSASSASRRFCAISEASLPPGLRKSSQVTIRLQEASVQLQPGKDGAGVVKAVGIGDRGSGLVYRAGRPASGSAIASAGPRQGVWVVKIQPPLDVSSDSAGGIGRMTPATLLLNDRNYDFVRFIKEEDEGHFQLLKCAIGELRQVAYRYAEEFNSNGPMLRVFTQLQPAPDQVGW
mmetsp:Transcript_41318/g.87990  ORF Transcript_41318/g.87990 Transcript_41318/m.87990 type:complete len:185 (+) Transcript_41318:97-651(+)